MLAMGLVRSPWSVLVPPAAVLIGFAFAAVGMARTSFMRSWRDFDFINLAIAPIFLFSGAFFQLSIYPAPVRLVVEALPL